MPMLPRWSGRSALCQQVSVLTVPLKSWADCRVYTAGTNKMILDPFQAEKDTDVARLKSQRPKSTSNSSLMSPNGGAAS